MAVILSLVDLDVTARYNCDVRCVRCLSPMNPRSDKPHLKAEIIFQFVSAPLTFPVASRPRNERLSVLFCQLSIFSSLGTWPLLPRRS